MNTYAALRVKQFFIGVTVLSVVSLTFTTPNLVSAADPEVQQGTTVTYGVLAATTITNTGATTLSGTAGSDIGLSPGTSFTNTGTVTTSGLTNIANSAATIAQNDLVTAFNDLSIPNATTIANLDLGGQTLTPGTYASGSSLANSTMLTFDALGDPDAKFIIRAGSTVTTSSASTMTLVNGAQACNIYWQVGSSATLGTNSTFVGHIYALTSITAATGATIYGQLLARNGAVTLDNNTIINAACTAASVTAPATVTTIPTTTTPTPTTVPRRVARTTTTTTKTARTTVTTSPKTVTPTSTPNATLPSTGTNSGQLAIAMIVLGIIAFGAWLASRRTSKIT